MRDIQDESAGFTLADLFEGHEGKLRAYARSLTTDPDWAEDLVSETFLRAMPRMAVLSTMHPAQRRAWLYKVLKNVFLDHLRSQKREAHLSEMLGGSEIEPPPEDLTVSIGASIPSHHRRILFLRYNLGMTSEEIGQRLNIPAATARSRLRLAIQWIKNHQNQGD